MSAQYHVVFKKNDVAVEGPDDADVVIRIDAKYASMNPTAAFMAGKLKNEGSTRALFEALWSGEAADVISRLASRS
ncbi:MAG: SCP2 sterol-binding domain-containing protein [Ilumatobacteraceae bacterium]